MDAGQADATGSTALLLACKSGAAACVAALLSARSIDLDQPDSRGNAPLFTACLLGESSCVEALYGTST